MNLTKFLSLGMKIMKDINVGITMLLKNTTIPLDLLLTKMLSKETEDILYVDLILCINLFLIMDLSVVLLEKSVLNPELITVVSNLLIYLKLKLEEVNKNLCLERKLVSDVLV